MNDDKKSKIDVLKEFSKTVQLKYVLRLVAIRTLNVLGNWFVFLLSPIWIAPAMLIAVIKNKDFVNNFLVGREGYFK